MGEVIDSRSAGTRAGPTRQRRAPVRARVLLRPRLPVHVSRRRAGRAGVRPRRLDAGVVGRRCSGALWPTIPRPCGTRARGRRASAPPRCGCRWCGPSASRPRCRPPCASARLRGRAGARRARSCSPPAGSRSAAASTSTTRRSWPRRRPPPGIVLEDCLHAAGDARPRRRDRGGRAAGCSAAGADRLPALRVGRSLFWGEQRVGAAAASVRQSTPALARRGSEPRCTGVTSPARICAFDRVDRVGLALRRSSTGASDGPSRVGLGEQQVEIGVRRVALGIAVIWRSSMSRNARAHGSRDRARRGGVEPPTGG